MNSERLTLTECHARLKETMGAEAPALVTLKRWSSTGRLDAGKAAKGSRRQPQFLFKVVEEVARKSVTTSRHKAAVIDHVLRKGVAPAVDAESRAPSKRVAVLDEDDLQRLLDRLTIKVETSAASFRDRMAEEVMASLRQAPLQEALMETVRGEVQKLGGKVAEALLAVQSIGRTMMQKYDAECTDLREKLAALKKENEELRKGASSILDVQRLNVTLAKVQDRLANIESSMASSAA